MFCAVPCDQLRRFIPKEEGSPGPAFVGGALRPTDGAAQGSSSRASETHCTGEVDNQAEQRSGHRILGSDFLTYSGASDTLHIGACDCSGKASRRCSVGSRHSAQPQRSLVEGISATACTKLSVHDVVQVGKAPRSWRRKYPQSSQVKAGFAAAPLAVELCAPRLWSRGSALRVFVNTMATESSGPKGAHLRGICSGPSAVGPCAPRPAGRGSAQFVSNSTLEQTGRDSQWPCCQ